MSFNKSKLHENTINKRILLQEVDESNQHDWYKKMYNTIHKVSDGGKLKKIMGIIRFGRTNFEQEKRRDESIFHRLDNHSLNVCGRKSILFEIFRLICCLMSSHQAISIVLGGFGHEIKILEYL